MDETESVAQEDLQDRLRFEALLADLSAGFVNLPPDRVDGAVIEAQRRICECFDLDRSSLWQASDSASGPWRLTHYHQVPTQPVLAVEPVTERSIGGDQAPAPLGDPPVDLRGDAQALFPWMTGRLQRGETVVVSSVRTLPAEAARDQESLRRIGTRSTVVIPLLAGGVVGGALSFGSIRVERTWPDVLVERLHQVAHVFAGALARKQADLRLRESEARLSLAAAAGGAGLWEFDLTTGRGWVSAAARMMYGFSPSEDITLDGIAAKIHPDDRDTRFEGLHAAIRDSSAYVSEHRIVLPDGRIRWIHVRGRTHDAAPKAPQKLLGVSIDITERKQAETHLRKALEDLRVLRDRLQQENVRLQAEVLAPHLRAPIIGQSRAIRVALAQAQQVAATASTVLLIGETGTGKERFATVIHELSARRSRSMIRVSCAAIPATLIESELFGREKGAYTGALSRQAGRFELANGSTIFLDEVGDLPSEVQVKLLRVLEEKQVERLGSPKPIAVDVRIIAATNRDLEAAVRAGQFREDLYYRLHVFPIVVPPLRERREDIPALAQMFVDEFAGTMGKRVDGITKADLDALANYAWPGNVRELRNVIERSMILATGRTLKIDIPRPHAAPTPAATRELNDVERVHILAVLEQTGWRIRGPRGAARILNLKPTTLETRMARLGITRPTATREDA